MLRRPHLRKCVSRLLARPGKLGSSLQEWEFASARGTDFHVKFSDDVDVKAALYNRAGKLIEFSREAWS